MQINSKLRGHGTAESQFKILSMETRELRPLHWLLFIKNYKNGHVTILFDTKFSIPSTNTWEATQMFKDNASWIVLAYNDGTKVCIKHIC